MTWDWLIHSDAGLALRIGVGAAIFAILALIDLARNGRHATRWREYALLLIAAVVAMAFGAINDVITSSISWEYFYYGKGLSEQLGPTVPPDPSRLQAAAALVGVKASWSAGLIIAVALLLANNPSKRLPRLRNRSLLIYLPIALTCVIVGGVLGGLTGYAGLPTHWNTDFAEMLQRDEMRPRRFMATYGVHLGEYLGGAVGMILALGLIRRRRRRRQRSAPVPAAV